VSKTQTCQSRRWVLALVNQSESDQEVIVFDPEKCTGCTYCMVSCSFKHYRSTDFGKSHIKILNDPVRRKSHFIGIHCVHCEDPLCLASCPVEAITKDTVTGLVRINASRCIGCKACILACPISNPSFDEERRIAVKCDFCDGTPQCVKFCATEALKKTTRGLARRQFTKS